MFLQCSAGQDFDWAERNCGFWVCEWIERETGRDPVAEYRNRFGRREFTRRVLKAGGTEAFSRMIAYKAGLLETETPQLGDVGLIFGDGATMAIKADFDRWAVKTSGGIAIGPFRCIVAWSIECLR
jgi:hypothetical protein